MSSGAGSTDTFAAEFVLGTLDADERRAANQLLASDEGFADRVYLIDHGQIVTEASPAALAGNAHLSKTYFG